MASHRHKCPNCGTEGKKYARLWNAESTRTYPIQVCPKCHLVDSLWDVFRQLQGKITQRNNQLGEVMDSLEWLVQLTNGCPLPKYEEDWNREMDRAALLIKSYALLKEMEKG